MYFTAGCRLQSAFVILDLLFRVYKNTSLKRRENPRAEELICGVWVANATWHSWSVLIFRYYDKQLIMQVAWIISVHLVAFGRSETSPAAGVRLAGGSKNTISQVVSHELKIARHSFPVRLPQPPPIPPPPQCSPSSPCSVTEGHLPPNRMKKPQREEEEKRGRGEREVWREHMTHISCRWPRPPPATVRLSSEDVFTMFYSLLSFFFLFFI